MEEDIKIGIIGCGHIGKRHAAVIDAADKARLASLCDIEIERATELADLYEISSTYNDYHDLINSGVNVVSICTPHFLHKPMTVDALQAGKDVIVEKPMALSTQDAEEMTDLATQLNRKLYVVKQNRFNVPIQLVGNAIEDKKLGKIFMVECNVMWNRHQAYYDQSDWRGIKLKEGGALFTQASHFIDILVWWFGDVVSANAKIATQNHNIEVEDAGIANVEFASGVLGAINWTTNIYNKNYEGSITIIGEYGTIKIGGAYLNQIEYWDVKDFPLSDDIDYVDLPNNYGKYQGSSSNHHLVFEEIIKNLAGEESSIVEGWEGTKSIKAIEKIYLGVK